MRDVFLVTSTSHFLTYHWDQADPRALPTNLPTYSLTNLLTYYLLQADPNGHGPMDHMGHRPMEPVLPAAAPPRAPRAPCRGLVPLG